MEEFTSDDVTKVYDYLISLRIKVPALKHIHQAMLDLSSKSYKRMWLEYKGNGIFSVSRVGKIHWQEIESEA
jgi:Ni,Fe-hydrogenase I large subunit